MRESKLESGRQVVETIEGRVRAGKDPTVAGWQAMLSDFLQQMAPYMASGRLVTFQTLQPREKDFFRALHAAVRIPEGAAALYLPPSVRHQMLYGRQTNKASLLGNEDPDNPPDDGILLASRVGDDTVIVNALFAHPPFTPAVDVYDHGQLIAGYTFYTVEECVQAQTEVIRVHLSTPPAPA